MTFRFLNCRPIWALVILLALLQSAWAKTTTWTGNAAAVKQIQTITVGVNEVQSVTITGTPTGGTFTLTYSGQTTGAIAFDADAATVDAALEALSNIGADDVTCTGGALPGAAVTVTFTGALAGTDVAEMTADGALLTGGTTPAASVTTTTAGGAGSWADADTATMTINGKDVVVTMVGIETTTVVATALKEAWMSPVRLDGTGTTDATSNAGGYEFGEFAEVTVTFSGRVVTLTANTPGVPFTVTVSETSATGALTLATVQAATGPHFWDNADNWDNGLPVDDDTVEFKNSDIPVKYNPPQDNLEVTGNIDASYTGEIGLRRVNRDNASKPYVEYRTGFVWLNAGGTGTSITHSFGRGDGQGSRLIRWVHTGDAGLTVSAIVYKTNGGTDEEWPLQLELENDSSVGAVSIFGGTVSLRDKQIGGTEFATLRVINGRVRLSGTGSALTINQTGGVIEFSDRFAMEGNLTLDLTGGTYLSRMASSANSVTATVENARLEWSSEETIDALEIRKAGIVDGEQDLRSLTLTACDLYEGASLLMGNGRAVTYTAGIDLNRTDLSGVTLRVGNNKRLSISAAP